MPSGLARITESPGHHMGMHLQRGCQADENLCKHGKFFRVHDFYQEGLLKCLKLQPLTAIRSDLILFFFAV